MFANPNWQPYIMVTCRAVGSGRCRKCGRGNYPFLPAVRCLVIELRGNPECPSEAEVHSSTMEQYLEPSASVPGVVRCTEIRVLGLAHCHFIPRPSPGNPSERVQCMRRSDSACTDLTKNLSKLGRSCVL